VLPIGLMSASPVLHDFQKLCATIEWRVI